MNLTPTKPVILAVDDDLAMRTLIVESLDQAGFTVEEAENGLEALEVFKQVHPDIVLTDVRMPTMNGFDFCLRLREQPGGDDIPIVFITGLDDVVSIQRAYEVGATDFITKPIDWLILSQRVRYILRASQAFRALRSSERKLAQAQSLAKIGHWEWDLQSSRVECASETLRIFGLPDTEHGNLYAALFKRTHPDDQSRLQEATRQALAGIREFDIDYRVVPEEGLQTFVHSRGRVIFDEENRPIRILGTTQDITERKKAEEKIRYLAYYDSLTDLPNRFLFKEKTMQALQGVQQSGRTVAVLQLDLDRFARINETLGHDAGDIILKSISRILRECTRGADIVARPWLAGEDSALVARFGGDEFTILLTGLNHPEDAAKVAERILAKLSEPLQIANQSLSITMSIGIAVYPLGGLDVDTLLKNAHAALSWAKQSGRNAFYFYTESMNKRALEKLNMESQLRQAIERDEISLHYQPQVDIKTGAIVGLEALMRWQHPTLGMVPPIEFIPLAEESELIFALGDWALQTACAQSKAWQAAGYAPLCMAVNLSSRQFKQPGLANRIQQILESTRLEARFLELEITESMLMDNITDSIVTLQQLKEMGMRLSIDDFGTGYSSLNYLKRFPVDKLKIDRSFITEVIVDSADAAIVWSVIMLAHNLALQVIAEGVETEQQLAFLGEHGCDAYQGYFFSKPVPAAELVDKLPKLPACR